MDTLHTPGCMTFKEDGDANHYSILDDSGHWWLALLHNGEAPSARQVANMRRLAAAWNACDSIATEALEEIGASGGFSEVVRSTAQHAKTAGRISASVTSSALADALRRYLDADPARDANGDTPASQARRALRMLVTAEPTAEDATTPAARDVSPGWVALLRCRVKRGYDVTLLDFNPAELLAEIDAR